MLKKVKENQNHSRRNSNEELSKLLSQSIKKRGITGVLKVRTGPKSQLNFIKKNQDSRNSRSNSRESLAMNLVDIINRY